MVLKKILAIFLVLTIQAAGFVAFSETFTIFDTAEVSTSRPDWSAEPMFDDDPMTWWEGTGSANGDYILMDFPEAVTLSGAEIYEGRNYKKETYSINRFKLQYSQDGEKWRDAYSGDTIGMKRSIEFPEITAKYIRLIVRGTPEIGNPAISELKLFYKETQPGIVYYVAKNGDDSNEGTLESPFATINKAAQIMVAGDTCIVREGIYRETVYPKNSGKDGNPITYKAYDGETVTISGADVVSAEWEQHSGHIYKTAYSRPVSQLYVGNSMMNLARWPNASVNHLLDEKAYAHAENADYDFVQHGQLPTGDWNGATVHIWPGAAWYAYEKEVVYDNKSPKRLSFKTPFEVKSNGYEDFDYQRPKTENLFFVYGVLAALDIPTEWLWQDDTLYLWMEGDKKPAPNEVEVQARDWAFDMLGNTDIVISGFNIFGSSIRLGLTTNCTVEKCNILYSSNNTERSVLSAVLAIGKNNTVRDCYIAYTQRDGVYLVGENNTVENCIIHDINIYGDYFAAVNTKGIGNRVVHNTMYNSGRFIVEHYDSKKLSIEYNIMHDGGKLTEDLGATYAWGTDGSGSTIAYNWIYNMGANRGIYLDNFCLNFNVHHNVIWDCKTGITLNSDSINNHVYNNTMINVTEAFTTYTYDAYTPTQKDTRVINNIYAGTTEFIVGANAPEVANNGAFAIGKNFVPNPGSPAIDNGVVIPGITDGFAGKAPDIGAYEYGGKYWTPGANWEYEVK